MGDKNKKISNQERGQRETAQDPKPKMIGKGTGKYPHPNHTTRTHTRTAFWSAFKSRSLRVKLTFNIVGMYESSRKNITVI